MNFAPNVPKSYHKVRKIFFQNWRLFKIFQSLWKLLTTDYSPASSYWKPSSLPSCCSTKCNHWQACSLPVPKRTMESWPWQLPQLLFHLLLQLPYSEAHLWSNLRWSARWSVPYGLASMFSLFFDSCSASCRCCSCKISIISIYLFVFLVLDSLATNEDQRAARHWWHNTWVSYFLILFC